MAVREVMDFLENGNIKNSVNYPDCEMGIYRQEQELPFYIAMYRT